MALSRFFVCLVLAAAELCAERASARGQLYEVRPMRRPGVRNPVPRSDLDPPSADRFGSSAAGRNSAKDTELSVEVFTGKEGVGLQAQSWQSTFERAGVPLRIRPGVPSDKIDVQERTYGKLRQVFVTGRLVRNGNLVFPNRTFTALDAGALEEWLRELKTYGAQGNPSGSALWGLTKDQFDDLFRALATQVGPGTVGASLDAAIASLRLPGRYPFRMSASADAALRAGGLRERATNLQLEGFAAGTALAMLLSQYGLGFQPNRTPSGVIELSCIVSEDERAVWPIGWDTRDGGTPASLAPALYRQTTAELKDQKLSDVLDAIAEKTGTAIRVDQTRLDAHQLNLDSIQVSVPNRRVTWALLLQKVTNPSFLTVKIRRDEAARPFVWITMLPHAPKVPTTRVRKP